MGHWCLSEIHIFLVYSCYQFLKKNLEQSLRERERESIPAIIHLCRKQSFCSQMLSNPCPTVSLPITYIGYPAESIFTNGRKGASNSKEPIKLQEKPFVFWRKCHTKEIINLIYSYHWFPYYKTHWMISLQLRHNLMCKYKNHRL